MKPAPPLDAKSILALQRTAGNRYVVSLLRKRTRRPVPEVAPEIVAEVPPEIPPEHLLEPPVKRARIAWWQPVITLVIGVAGYEGARLIFPASPAAAIVAGVTCAAATAASSWAYRVSRAQGRGERQAGS